MTVLIIQPPPHVALNVSLRKEMHVRYAQRVKCSLESTASQDFAFDVGLQGRRKHRVAKRRRLIVRIAYVHIVTIGCMFCLTPTIAC